MAPPPPPIPLFSWTGVYVGGQIGYAWGNDHADVLRFAPAIPAGVFLAHNTFSDSPSGVIGGAHVGYNLQINQWVLGIEGTVDGTSLKKTVFVPFLANGVTETTRSEIQGSIRGRIGWAFDRVLVYATGGAAFGGITNTYAIPQPAFFLSNSFATTKVGWTVGAGLEYAITDNWSVRAEYRYSDFGRVTDHPFAAVFNPGVVLTSSHHFTQNQVQVGFSYKFNLTPPPVPVVAKY
jgi:outer membrane immunogenic protein